MMNLLALSLIATSLVVSGLFSPNPVTNNNGEQVIVKDGHRSVVVEYADVTGDGNTKVSISPPHQHQHEPKVSGSGSGLIEEELGRATASVVGVAEDVKEKAKEAMHVHGGSTPRELICDAYGKCKHKVAGVLSRAKGKAVEAEETVEETFEEAVDMVKGFAGRGAEKFGEKIEDVKKTGEKVKEKTEEMVKETGEKTGEKVKKAGEMVKEKTEDLVEETQEKVKEKGKKGKKEIKDIGKRWKEVGLDVIRYVFGAKTIGSLMNMMGIAIAYGVGVWVTFGMSYVLASVLGRQQFGMVQSKVYPVYFKVMVGSIGLALLGHLLGHKVKMFKSKPEILQGYNLMTCLLMVLANLLFLEPRATKVMFQRMKLEKEEGRGIDGRGAPAKVIDTVVTDSTTPPSTTTTTAARTTVTETPSVAATPAPNRTDQEAAKSKLVKLDDKLKKLNSYSSLLNIMTLMGLTWHLVYLSQRLGVTT